MEDGTAAFGETAAAGQSEVADNTGQLPWSEERRARLTELRGRGWSAREIAEALGGVTRNAVIGMAARLGLSRPTKASLSRRRKAEAAAPAEIMGKALYVPAATEPVRGQAVTLLQLKPRHCRWPLWADKPAPAEAGGAGERLFCGARAEPGGPYCAGHARMAAGAPNHTARRGFVERGIAGARDARLARLALPEPCAHCDSVEPHDRRSCRMAAMNRRRAGGAEK